MTLPRWWLGAAVVPVLWGRVVLGAMQPPPPSPPDEVEVQLVGPLFASAACEEAVRALAGLLSSYAEFEQAARAARGHCDHSEAGTLYLRYTWAADSIERGAFARCAGGSAHAGLWVLDWAPDGGALLEVDALRWLVLAGSGMCAGGTGRAVAYFNDDRDSLCAGDGNERSKQVLENEPGALVPEGLVDDSYPTFALFDIDACQTMPRSISIHVAVTLPGALGTTTAEPDGDELATSTEETGVDPTTSASTGQPTPTESSGVPASEESVVAGDLSTGFERDDVRPTTPPPGDADSSDLSHGPTDTGGTPVLDQTSGTCPALSRAVVATTSVGIFLLAAPP